MSGAPSRQFPQRELHLRGARPTPLSLSKQSRNIRKQKAVPPPPAAAEAKSYRHHPPPFPVIIYTVSPKKIHVDPDEFMSLVQRLTGLNTSSSTLNTWPTPPSSSAFEENGGGVFPASQPTSNGNDELLDWRETQFSDGGYEMPQNLLWNATDPNHLNNGLHGNRNLNNLMMNMPSSSNFDVFNYLYDI